ncbi:hypothetical protein GALMADRAFT_222496 [Galerina marginata CBS 339.88]|uniref:F-box domain-containing protein n=1 Tax=Galerina marginata (strain CBS 339.88) TaxID=685588 RepID=A0A067TCM0_GALM3|nr:hypothetical protein GALMADRAFT_222496 [Galerina marginata CBS 339.88]
MVPNLPPELKNLIVAHLEQIPNATERHSALSSAALVSHHFRYQAHSHLFANVILHSVYNGSPRHTLTHLQVVGRRLRNLCQLIHADPDSERTGIASHIKNFELTLQFSALDDNTALPFILRRLFKTGTSPCSLSLSFHKYQLHQDLIPALQVVCRNPVLKTLRLSQCRGLPVDLLRHSSVRNIYFKQVSFLHSRPDHTAILAGGETSPSDCEQFDSSEGVFSESIETDCTYSLKAILDWTPDSRIPSYFLFSKLKDITFCLDWTQQRVWDEATAITFAAGALEQLKLELSKYSMLISPSRFTLRHLPLLHSVVLVPSEELFSNDIAAEIGRVFHDDHLPPSLKNLQIHFHFIITHHWWRQYENNDIFSQSISLELDALLSDVKFCSLTSLIVRCNLKFLKGYRVGPSIEEQLLENARLSLICKFPRAQAKYKFITFETIIT